MYATFAFWCVLLSILRCSMPRNPLFSILPFRELSHDLSIHHRLSLKWCRIPCVIFLMRTMDTRTLICVNSRRQNEIREWTVSLISHPQGEMESKNEHPWHLHPFTVTRERFQIIIMSYLSPTKNNNSILTILLLRKRYQHSFYDSFALSWRKDIVYRHSCVKVYRLVDVTSKNYLIPK